MGGKPCPVCKQPMTRFFTGWKCMNVKAHAKAKRNANKPDAAPRNPRGGNQYVPARPRKKGRWVLTVCPNCENGRRFNKKKCQTCNKKGRIWTIK